MKTSSMQQVLKVIFLSFLPFMLTACAVSGSAATSNNNSNTESNDTVDHGGVIDPTLVLPTATDEPEIANSPAPLNKSSLESVVAWLHYAIDNHDIDALNSISADEVGYVVYIEGGDWKDKSRFLEDYSLRIDSSPVCIGSGYGEDYPYIAWYSNWNPDWKVTESCYFDCTTFKDPIISDVVGFLIYGENGVYTLHKLWINDPELLVSLNPSTMNACSLTSTTSKSVNSSNPPEGSCPGAPPQRMIVGKKGEVCTRSDAVALRSDPNKSASVILRLIPGAEFTVTDGPKCANNWSWWKIRTNNNTVGWISEGGDSTDPYFICP